MRLPICALLLVTLLAVLPGPSMAELEPPWLNTGKWVWAEKQEQMLLDAEHLLAHGRYAGALPRSLILLATPLPEEMWERATLVKAECHRGLNENELAIEAYEELVEHLGITRVDKKALLNLGCSYYDAGNYRACASTFGVLLEMDLPSKERDRLLFFRGECLYRLSRFDDAVRSYNGVRSDSPWASASRHAAGWCYIEIGDLEEARNAFGEAAVVARDPHLRDSSQLQVGAVLFLQELYHEVPGALEGLLARRLEGEMRSRACYLVAESLTREGRAAEAHEYYGCVLEAESETSYQEFSQYGAGWASLQAEEWEDAERSFSLFLEDYPSSEMAPAALYGLGVALYRGERLEDAAETFAIVAGSGDGSEWEEKAFMGLARSSYELRRYDIAREACRGLLSRFPESPDRHAARFMIGEAFYSQKSYQDAVEAYRWLLGTDSRSIYLPQALFRMGMAYTRMWKHTAAAQTFGQLVAEAGDSPYAEEAQFLLAEAWYRAGDYPRAIQEYERSAGWGSGRGSRRFEALYGKAWAYYEMRDYLTAAEEFRQVLREFPAVRIRDDIEYRVGNCYFDLRERDEALRWYLGVVNKFPESELYDDALYQIAWTYYREENFGQAKMYLEKVAGLEPPSPLVPQSLYWSAWSDFRRGALDDALESFRRTMTHEATPDSLGAESALRMGDCYYNMEHYGLAERAYRWVTEEFPGTRAERDAYYGLVWCYRKLGMDSMAGDLAEDLAKRFPESELGADLLLRLGEQRFQSGQYEDAIRLLEQVSGPMSDDLVAQSTLLLGKSLARVGRYKDASAMFETLLASSGPRSAVTSEMRQDALMTRGLSLYAEGELEEAGRAFGELVEEFPSSPYVPNARYNAAIVYKELGDTTGALEQFREVVKLTPTNEEQTRMVVSSYLQAGILEHERGNWKEARANLEQVVSRGTPVQAAEAQYWIGEGYMAKEEWEEALSAYEGVAAVSSGEDFWALNAQYRKAECLVNMERWEEAGAAYEAILSGPGDEAFKEEAEERLRWLRLVIQADEATPDTAGAQPESTSGGDLEEGQDAESGSASSEEEDEDESGQE